MFSKHNQPSSRKRAVAATAAAPPAQAPQPQPQPPRPRSVSMIGEGVFVAGDILGPGELHLDCAVRGDIHVDQLVVCQQGRVEGAIQARLVEVRGRVVGAITAQQVRIYATGSVQGDISHEQLAMETGADFQGRSLRRKRAEPAQPQPQPQPQPVLARL